MVPPVPGEAPLPQGLTCEPVPGASCHFRNSCHFGCASQGSPGFQRMVGGDRERAQWYWLLTSSGDVSTKHFPHTPPPLSNFSPAPLRRKAHAGAEGFLSLNLCVKQKSKALHAGLTDIQGRAALLPAALFVLVHLPVLLPCFPPPITNQGKGLWLQVSGSALYPRVYMPKYMGFNFKCFLYTSITLFAF